MDDLLNNDIMQGGDEALEVAKQESRNKRQQKSGEVREALDGLHSPFETRHAEPINEGEKGSNTNPRRRDQKI